jgi:hypothetical protein
MSVLNPVLYGRRLFGRETYSANQDPQTFNLSFSESVSSADALADQLTKPLSDTTTLLDAYAVMLTLVKTDSMTLSDAKALVVTKPLSDSLSSSDSKAITATKALLDALASSDSMKFNNTKHLSDSMTLSEAFMISFGHSFSEMLTLIDSKAITTRKVLSEGPISTMSILYGQPLFGRQEYSNNNISNTPPIHIVDSLAFMLTKPFADSLMLSDSQQRILTKAVFDSIASIDPRIIVTLTKHLSETLLVQDWLSIQIIKPMQWVVPAPAPLPYSTLYGRVLFGRNLYSGLSGPPWMTVKPGQPSANGWRSYNQLEAQP